MSIEDIVQEVRAEIARLQKVLALLGGVSVQKRRPVLRVKRSMSAAARKRISQAQKARWAKWKAAKK